VIYLAYDRLLHAVVYALFRGLKTFYFVKLFLKRAVVESRILSFKSQHIGDTPAQGYSFIFTVGCNFSKMGAISAV
jgi:hypothetical protein